MSLNIDARTMAVFHFDGADEATADTNDARWHPVLFQPAISFHGSAQLDTAQKKFGTSSVLFNGSTDYLQIGDDNNFSRYLHGENNPIGVFQFTVECWIKKASAGATGDQCLFSSFPSGASSSAIGFLLRLRDTHKIQAFIADGSGTAYFNIQTLDNVVPNDTDWHHIAFSFDDTLGSNQGKVFVDGTLVGQGSVTGSSPATSSGSKLTVGRQNNSTNYFAGWMDEIRIQNSVKYSASFIAPTAPFNNIFDNTEVLSLDFEGSDGQTSLIDTGLNQFNIAFSGTAQIDTDEFIIGTSSIFFDGNSDYIEIGTEAPDWNWLIGSMEDSQLKFTIDFYVKKFSTGDSGNQTILTTELFRSGSQAGIGIHLRTGTNSLYSNLVDDAVFAVTGIVDNSFPDDTNWHHVAITYDNTLGSNNLKYFLDGQLKIQVDRVSGQNPGHNKNSTALMRLGAQGNNTEYFHGWIDRFRIHSEILWTSNFSPEGISTISNNFKKIPKKFIREKSVGGRVILDLLTGKTYLKVRGD